MTVKTNKITTIKRIPFGEDKEFSCEVQFGKFGGLYATYLFQNGEPFKQTYYSMSDKVVKSNSGINAIENEDGGFSYSNYAPLKIGAYTNHYANGFIKTSGCKNEHGGTYDYKFYKPSGYSSVKCNYLEEGVLILASSVKAGPNIFGNHDQNDVRNLFPANKIVDMITNKSGDIDGRRVKPILDLFDKNTLDAMAVQQYKIDHITEVLDEVKNKYRQKNL